MKLTQRKLCLALALAAFVPFATPSASAGTPSFGFGMDLASMDTQTNAGARPDYGMVWVGTWTMKSGWSSTDALFDKARARGVTPVVQYYYWGNDISRNCLENGCWSGASGVWKSRAGWAELGRQLGEHLRARMGGAPVVVVLETEFNKGDAGTYEPLDGYLAERAYAIRGAYPSARVALGFGNWGSTGWGTFDRAVWASDLTGLQGMRATTRNSESAYLGLVDATLAGAKELQRRFGKPVFITDIAASTYPEPDYLWRQATVIGNFFARIGELKAAGVQGLVYRSYYDSPTATTAEYFGEAERHFGVAWSGGGAKPAWDKWKNGVAAVRGGAAATSTSTSLPAAPYYASTPLTLEAERFASRPIGGDQYDTTASASHRWNLWSNGRITQGVQFQGAGLYELRVRTQGQVLSNVAPHLNVYLDGTKVTARDPWSGGWSDAVGQIRVAAGAHTVALEYTNDAHTSSGDRNLLLDRVQVVWVGA
jgi:predicted xylan-binding protein with Ca-dependent carbohydrate-binding module